MNSPSVAISKRPHWSRLVSFSLLLICGFASQAPIRASELVLNITNVSNLPAPGTAYYDPNGLTGDIYKQSALQFGIPVFTSPDLAMPGPGPVSGELPKIALLFQYSVDPSSITPDDFAPLDNWNTSFSYSATGSFMLSGGMFGIPYHSSYPFGFEFTDSFASLAANPGWWLADSTNGQDTWVHVEIASFTATGGQGFIAFATTDTTIIDPFLPLPAITGALIGGDVTINFTAVPELGSLSITGLGFGVVLVGYSIRRRFPKYLND